MIKKCKNCNQEFETRRSSKQHCSPICFSQWRKRPDVLAETLSRREKTNIEIYGVDNPAKALEIKEKAKNTCNERYNGNSPMASPTVIQKQKTSLYKNYGVKNPTESDEIRKKQKQTCLRKYGVEFPIQSEHIKQKIKDTCLQRYGVSNPSQSKKIKSKTKKILNQKYGNHPMRVEAIRDKMVSNRLKSQYSRIVDNKYKESIPMFSEQEYIGNKSTSTKYRFKCKSCAHEFQDTLISGNIPLCPKCHPPKEFYEENELYQFIKSIVETPIERKNRKLISPLELDIYVPDKKIAIELNGLYWHSESAGKKGKYYHIKKTNDCEKLGVRLVQIFEDEWVKNRSLVEDRLRHIFGNNKTVKIPARKCEIKEISAEASTKFLNENHLQGSDKSSVRIGLIYRGKVLAVMTFGKIRRVLGNRKISAGEYEMYRFCVQNGYSITGAASKLLKYFMSIKNPDKIISYADRRWSGNNNVYEKIGFELKSVTSAGYWYIDPNYKNRVHRYNFSKFNQPKKLKYFDKSLTEWENMRNNGWDRIWDCGNLKYEMTVR